MFSFCVDIYINWTHADYYYHNSSQHVLCQYNLPPLMHDDARIIYDF